MGQKAIPGDAPAQRARQGMRRCAAVGDSGNGGARETVTPFGAVIPLITAAYTLLPVLFRQRSVC